MEKIPSPMKAIRMKCIECSGGVRQEVKLCPVTGCALYPYRLGHRPKLEDLSDAETDTEDEDHAE